MEIKVRKMKLRDIFSFSTLYLSLPEEDKKLFHPFPLQKWKLLPVITYIALSSMFNKYLRKIIPKFTFLALIAEDIENKKIAGFAYLHIKGKYSPNKYTANLGIVVSKEYRGHHIGSLLMKRLIKTAKENEIKKIELDVLTQNTPAINLYKKYGFVIEGEIKTKCPVDKKTYRSYKMGLEL
ncbi:GNAT family N-acetyltransferase [Thermococcus sp. SY098]|uniref:GNAT family N-acetyltransferase n=1 Tax=Thermococcus sp. SY098 TaxID=3111325 RepID=UPI002D77F0C1|nr:GNAT family N-acetyltransferase [Thermococcus sp. SY098]WRS52140.1 GNAT family N-acetyltransferase [Thermococcus sp. SY098]